MASVSKKPLIDKNSRKYWRVQVSRGTGNAPFETKFFWPQKENGDPVSEKVAQKQLNEFVNEYERKCKAGEVLTRQQKREAEEKKKQEEAEKARQAASIKTVKQYAEKVFLPAKEITCKENTRSYYSNALANHILPRFGEYKLPEVTTAMLSAFMQELQKPESGLAHSTIIGIYITLNQIFKMAYFEESIDKNPMDRVQRPKKKKSEAISDDVESFTVDELRFILEKLTEEPLKWQTMIRLMIDTGCRKGEACGLKWENVDFENEEITIIGNLCYTPAKGIYMDTPKSGKVRTIPVSSETISYLTRLHDEQEENRKKRTNRLEKEGKPLDIDKVRPSEYVFNEKGYADPMHPQSPTRFFRKFGEKYGIDHFHPHKLRHSFASIAITNGADIASVSEILGHADKATTLKMYTHADKESMRRASETFRKAFEISRKAE